MLTFRCARERILRRNLKELLAWTFDFLTGKLVIVRVLLHERDDFICQRDFARELSRLVRRRKHRARVGEAARDDMREIR